MGTVNNKTNPIQVIEAGNYNANKVLFHPLSFSSNLICPNNLDTQKLHLHTKNSSLNRIELYSSYTFPVHYDHYRFTDVIECQHTRTSTCTNATVVKSNELPIQGINNRRFSSLYDKW